MVRDDEKTLEVPGTVDESAEEPRPGVAGAMLAGRYRLARLMGKGGMGEVISARDEQIGREVAIKRMKAARPSERAIQRFLREASIQGRLEHPAIVPVHEIGRDTDGLPFFAMKKLAGTTLAKILDEPAERFPRQRVLRAFVDACLAVELAHVRGVVHRDLNPNNIMLGDFGEVYVLDWGVAKVVGEEDSGFADVDSGSGSGELATQAGAAVGTPGYMAPEQVRGQTVDGRADVYTLGCLLFEILAGEPLHPRGAGMTSALARVDARPSARAPERGAPPELDAVCVQATARDPEERPSARELGDRVQRFLDGDRDVALRRELAREHLERARAAFAGGEEAGGDVGGDAGGDVGGDDVDARRRTAMREAAAALALDPSLSGAAELVGRLMLEPPKTTPREVLDAIAADDVRTSRVNAKAGIVAVLATIGFLPAVWWMAPGAGGYLAALTAALSLSGMIALYNLHAARPRVGFAVLGNMLVVALIALMFSPILIAPGIAAVLGMAMVVTPRLSPLNSAAGVTLLMIAGVFGPWAAELFGLASPTLSALGDGIALRAPAVQGNELATIVVGMSYSVGLIIGAVWVAEAMRNRIGDAHRHLRLQAWQLRQLVPR
ncbi:MAG TPA: serine/threonine-protein kinase [Kofleriaceae bacterium]|nr:serine/threonine-protein kinase [Kofleriaceae bacterium]